MKLKNLLKRIPRPLKAIVCTILVLFLMAAYYIALGCPTLTLEQEFRRAEKIHMVGPSTIVDKLDKSEYSEFNTLIVGETKEGICFFGRWYSSSRESSKLFPKYEYSLSYVKKTGDLTLTTAPTVSAVHWGLLELKQSLPVYLFTDNQAAVRAKVAVRVYGSYTYYTSDEKVERTFSHSFWSETTRSENGYFRFTFTSNSEASGYALYYLSEATGGGPYALPPDIEECYPATVWLYDEAGNLIEERDILVGNPYGTPTTP